MTTTIYFDHVDYPSLSKCWDVVITANMFGDDPLYYLAITVHNSGGIDVNAKLTLWYKDQCPPPFTSATAIPLITVTGVGIGNGTQVVGAFKVPAYGSATEYVGWSPGADVTSQASVFIQASDTSQSDPATFGPGAKLNAQQVVDCAPAPQIVRPAATAGALAAATKVLSPYPAVPAQLPTEHSTQATLHASQAAMHASQAVMHAAHVAMYLAQNNVAVGPAPGGGRRATDRNGMYQTTTNGSPRI